MSEMTEKVELVPKPFLVEAETTPRLRFPEFRNAGEWRSRRVDEVFQVTRGEVLAMPLVDEDPSPSKPYPVYSSQTKHNGLAGYYSEFLYSDAITWTTDGANAGEVRFRAGKFFCTNVCGVLLSRDGSANNCMAALLNSVARSYVSYVGNPKLMNNVMASIQIPMPSISEQRKIAECLESLDELIAAETEKLEALKRHKKGLLQQLFPAEGETTPRLRFPEFSNSDEWRKAKLGECCDIKAAGDLDLATFSSSQTLIHSYPIYSNGIEGEGLYGFTTKASGPSGSITITARGTLGVAFFRESDFSAIGRLLVVNPSPSLTGYFLQQFWNHSIHLPREVTSIPQLTAVSARGVEICFPGINEQRRISLALSSNDLASDSVRTLVKILRTHKAALMQQLFPSLEEVDTPTE